MSTVAQLLQIAAAQVGYHEGRDPNGNWNNKEKFAAQVPGLAWADGQPWCAVFVAWCAMKAGAADLFPCSASTDVDAAWFKQRGQWSEYPAVGAQGFLGVNGNMDHTFIVERYDATYVYTIEGNTNTNGSAEGDGVYRRQRLRRETSIQGYGYPKFPGGLDSADPSYHRPAAAPSAKPAPAPATPPAKPYVPGPAMRKDKAALRKLRDQNKPGSAIATAVQSALNALNKIGKKK